MSVNPLVVEDGILSLPSPSDLCAADAIHDSGRKIDEVHSALHLEKFKYEVPSREAGKLCKDLLIHKSGGGKNHPCAPFLQSSCVIGLSSADILCAKILF